MKITISKILFLFLAAFIIQSCSDDLKTTYIDYTDEEYENVSYEW